MRQTVPSDMRIWEAIWVAVRPEMAIASTCASKSAVKCEFGRTSQGICTVCTPCSGQSALGMAQCTIVSYCQMSRCLQVRSRAS